MLAANTEQHIKHETQSTNSAQSCGSEIPPTFIVLGLIIFNVLCCKL